MAIRNLHILELRKSFKSSEVIETSDLMSFYAKIEPEIPRGTVNWRVHYLIDSNVLARVGRGKFVFVSERGAAHRVADFKPLPGKKVQAINSFIKKNFPFIKYCVWDSRVINEFAHHLTSVSFILVDCEREVCEAVFHRLSEKFTKTYLKPKKETLELYATNSDRGIIVRPLVSESPIQVQKSVPSVTIEKLLVDLATDNEFYFLRGHELSLIFENAMSKYGINWSTLLRYAARKNKKKAVEKFYQKSLQ